MKLEEIVPPLEMCKRIPEGSFENSALVWAIRFCARGYASGNIVIALRHDIEDSDGHRILSPAPTLAEIMAELDKRWDDVCMWNDAAKNWWDIQVENIKTAETHGKRDRNSAAAALRLWLEVNGIE